MFFLETLKFLMKTHVLQLSSQCKVQIIWRRHFRKFEKKYYKKRLTWIGTLANINVFLIKRILSSFVILCHGQKSRSMRVYQVIFESCEYFTPIIKFTKKILVLKDHCYFPSPFTIFLWQIHVANACVRNIKKKQISWNRRSERMIMFLQIISSLLRGLKYQAKWL